MPRRGYPLKGPRAGGITRLAADAGIPQATMSRLVNGIGEPSTETLRRIGAVLGYSLGEMMVRAGLAQPSEMARPNADPSTTAPHPAPLKSVPTVQLGAPGDPDPADPVTGIGGLRLTDDDKSELEIWMMTVLPWQTRATLIQTLRDCDAEAAAERRPNEPRAGNGTET
jgi:transcriptional regulator with XRE-family HTH domain